MGTGSTPKGPQGLHFNILVKVRKLALKKETDNVNDNLINAQTFGQKIFQLEPDYQRLSTYFDGQVKGAIAKFPELKQVLADNSK